MGYLVVYCSKTGFTKKYAEWLGNALSCEVLSLKEVNQERLNGVETVIFGGSLMGGIINGYSKIAKMNCKKLIVFGVGFSEDGEHVHSQCVQVNKLGDTPFFYMRGGIDYKKLGFMKGAMLKKITGQSESIDFTDKKNINCLIESL